MEKKIEYKKNEEVYKTFNSFDKLIGLSGFCQPKVTIPGALSHEEGIRFLSKLPEMKPDFFDEEEEREELAEVPEYESHVYDGLAYVGIVSTKFKVSSLYYRPHNRDFRLIEFGGEFRYEGNEVDYWMFPQCGAEKYSRNGLNRVGVESERGVVSNGQMVVAVIDAARHKLDGEEIIVYGISTKAGIYFFRWGADEHVKIDADGPGHFEKVNGEIYWL